MQLLKPPPLHQGDTIGLIAPSFPLLPAWRTRYEHGKEMLAAMGFAIKEGRTLGLRRYWAAATPQDQADDINSMFADPSVKGIITLTGRTSTSAIRAPTPRCRLASWRVSTPKQPH